MPNKTRTFIFIGIALIVVGGIGYLNIQNDRKDDIAAADDVVSFPADDKEGLSVKETEAQSDTPIVSSDDVTKKKPVAGAMVAVTKMAVPDLNRPIIFPGGYSAEKAKEITGQIGILTDTLKADNDRFNEWLDLGMLRKSIEDYDGAREAWEYAGAIRPGNSLSFVNLGMIYGYYLHEPLKAEANLLHAIENEPRFLDFYARMSDFYVEVMNDKGKAIDFLDRAIEKYPEWTELKDLRGYITR